MKKTEAEALAATLNDNQRYALTYALESGVGEALDHGRSLRRKDCTIRSGYRAVTPAPTRRFLRKRGLLEGSDYNANLTTDGVKVAHIVFASKGVKIEHEEAEGIVFETDDIWEYVRYMRQRRENEKREHKAKVSRAAHLWRGFKFADAPYGSRTKAISAAIKREFAEDNYYRDGITLDLDELIAIGEQIRASEDRHQEDA